MSEISNARKLLFAGILVAAAIGIWAAWLRTPAGLSPETLLKSALTVEDPKARLGAALELTHRQEDFNRVMPLMRRLADESKDPEVIAVALGVLTRYADTASVDRFIDAMAHESARVRAQGAQGMKALGGGSIGVSLGLQPNRAPRFSATDPPAVRQAVVQQLRDLLKKFREEEEALKATWPTTNK